ncbi:transcriptional regulator with XRE-family HTH domain [Paenibacillus anaericanus]|uniref:helix-turn-helix domain-containing protein n=1 Tax=Paenibacillus anaericanus TaxID=170367 RepID=UPI0027865A9C|nr:helix-turn-helix transcriptional regulator [Paenibacillus anaericanus]MDQ0089997.1 transcriptional regulator with XRE-family HTH domain [Paenibacillus anaericanus]
MIQVTTIGFELEDYLKRYCITINQFAEISGVNSGTISSIIKGIRPTSILQLDRITEGMGLEKGSFYDLYVDECFNHPKLNWRRLRPLIYRCAELDKLDCIERVLGMMMDNISYGDVLFDTAEDLFKQGKREAAGLLYEGVAESEKYQHSERLAICRYRMFNIALGDDQDANLQAAVQFETFVDRLDEVDQLDALKDLANTYNSLRRWDKLEKTAKEMGHKASIQYKYRYGDLEKKKFFKEPTMPLFAYISYSHVLCSVVYDERKDYDTALQYVSLYSEFSWIKEESEEALQLVCRFKDWAEGNTYLYTFMKGDIKVLPEYISYIDQRKDEILPALFKIIQTANRYKFNVDDILTRFAREIVVYRDEQGNVGTYSPRIIEDRFTHFMAELAYYYLIKGEYDTGIEYILESMESSVRISSENCIIRCVSLFEQYRYTASLEAQRKYEELMRRRNEKKHGVIDGSFE